MAVRKRHPFGGICLVGHVIGDRLAGFAGAGSAHGTDSRLRRINGGAITPRTIGCDLGQPHMRCALFSAAGGSVYLLQCGMKAGVPAGPRVLGTGALARPLIFPVGEGRRPATDGPDSVSKPCVCPRAHIPSAARLFPTTRTPRSPSSRPQHPRIESQYLQE